MVRIGKAWPAAAAALLLAGCQHSRPEPVRAVSLIVEDVTVVDPETRRVLPDRSVVVDGDRIVEIVASGRAGGYRARRVVKGTGKFLIPGLMDMHVHLFLPEPPEGPLKLLLANGVTGIREMSSDCWAIAGAKQGCVGEYKALQASLRSGETVGPELESLTSTMVMGRSRQALPEGAEPFIVPRSGEEARRLVRYLKGRGVDRIKTHDSIPGGVFLELMGEARSLGIEVGGHVPFGAGSLGAAEAGYGSIEHARDLLYDCSRFGPELRRLMDEVAEQKAGAVRPSNLVRMKRTVDEFDPKRCEAFLARLARTGTHYVPTHVTREMEARAGDPAYRSDPAREYVSRARNASWDKDLEETASVPAEEKAALESFFRHGLLITRMAHLAGVPVMAGTDASDTMIVPGFSLHRELELLVEAGLSPMDALRSATSLPAKYLGVDRLNGGISAGKEADLVLLGADPLEDVRNTRSIEAVLSNGRLFDRTALDSLLAEAERAASGPPPGR